MGCGNSAWNDVFFSNLWTFFLFVFFVLFCFRFLNQSQSLQSRIVDWIRGIAEKRNSKWWVIDLLDVTFSLYWGENIKILYMLRFEQEVSKYLVSKFVLKYNIKPWEYFHPVCCWRMLRWIASSVCRNWSVEFLILQESILSAHK